MCFSFFSSPIRLLLLILRFLLHPPPSPFFSFILLLLLLLLLVLLCFFFSVSSPQHTVLGKLRMLFTEYGVVGLWTLVALYFINLGASGEPPLPESPFPIASHRILSLRHFKGSMTIYEGVAHLNSGLLRRAPGCNVVRRH